jgi:DNA-binding SARP family transcriptional activator
MAFDKAKSLEAARKYIAKGSLDKAIKELLQVVAAEPADVRVWLQLGDLYAKKGAKREAIDAYLRVAHSYEAQGFFLKAVAVYKQTVELDSRRLEVMLKLADLHHRLGLTSDAVRYEDLAAQLQAQPK